jgi:hypothetical protein
MLAQYTNRQKEAHYVKISETKSGSARYYIVKNKSKYEESELKELRISVK